MSSNTPGEKKDSAQDARERAFLAMVAEPCSPWSQWRPSFWRRIWAPSLIAVASLSALGLIFYASSRPLSQLPASRVVAVDSSLPGRSSEDGPTFQSPRPKEDNPALNNRPPDQLVKRSEPKSPVKMTSPAEVELEIGAVPSRSKLPSGEASTNLSSKSDSSPISPIISLSPFPGAKSFEVEVKSGSVFKVCGAVAAPEGSSEVKITLSSKYPPGSKITYRVVVVLENETRIIGLPQELIVK